MGACGDLLPEEERANHVYYEQLLQSVLSYYNSIHVLIYHFLCALGVVSNICVIVVLLQPPMRRIPFNVFLVAIAICDMTLMACYFIFKQVDFCHPTFFTYNWVVFTLVYALLSVFVHSTSLWLTVNMAVLRYLVLRDSSNSGSSRLNSYKSAFVVVFLALLISLIGAAPNMLRYEIADYGLADVPQMCLLNGSAYAERYLPGQKIENYAIRQPAFWNCSWERFSFWVAGIVLKLIPCVLLTVFMTLLVRMLVEARDRRNRLAGSAGAPHNANTLTGNTQAERTTAMLTMIVALFLITELPQGLLVFAIGINPRLGGLMRVLGNVLDLLSLLNSSVNFILYATMSNQFRSEFLRTFGACCPRSLRHWHSQRQLRHSGSSTRPIHMHTSSDALRGSRKAQFKGTNSHEQVQRLIQNGHEQIH